MQAIMMENWKSLSRVGKLHQSASVSDSEFTDTLLLARLREHMRVKSQGFCVALPGGGCHDSVKSLHLRTCALLHHPLTHTSIS